MPVNTLSTRKALIRSTASQCPALLSRRDILECGLADKTIACRFPVMCLERRHGEVIPTVARYGLLPLMEETSEASEVLDV